MTIVETTVWIDYLNNVSNRHTGWLDQNLRSTRIAVLDLILCEVLQGMRNDADFRATKQELQKFPVLSTGGARLAVASAGNYRALRKRGIIVRTSIDCMIATACIDGGHFLLHRDRDYTPFEMHLGLKAIHP